MTPVQLAHLHGLAFHDSRGWSAEEFTDLLARPTTHLITTEHSFVLISYIRPEAEILTVVTDPAHQRKGLARQALSDLESYLSSQGADRLFLEVAEDNIPAQRLYARLNYTEIARREAYYTRADGTKVSAIILQKALQKSPNSL